MRMKTLKVYIANDFLQELHDDGNAFVYKTRKDAEDNNSSFESIEEAYLEFDEDTQKFDDNFTDTDYTGEEILKALSEFPSELVEAVKAKLLAGDE